MCNDQIKTNPAGLQCRNTLRVIPPWLVLIGLALLASGCGDNPLANKNPGGVPPVGVDNALTPTTDDMQAFKLNVWENLKGDNRCGSCHGAGGQSPTFADATNISVAYTNAVSVVNITDPASSRMVAKVGENHNCWLTSPSGPPDLQSCTTILTGYIAAWVGGTGDTSGRQIDLKAPTIKNPGQSRNFPVTAQENGASSFANTVYPLLIAHCANCHSNTAATPQAPFFATTDVNTSYQAAKSKMDLDLVPNSRFVLRLRNEFHNCWGDCQADATEMQAAIAQFAGAIQITPINPNLITSKAMLLTDAIVASGGTRHENNLIALWEFKAGTGDQANDTSGVEPAMNLTFNNKDGNRNLVSWVLGYGIEIKQSVNTVNSRLEGGRASAGTASSKKLSTFIKASGEYAVEAWVVPANVTQVNSSIVTYSSGGSARNFTMGQTMYNYDFINLSDKTDGTMNTKLMTDNDDEDLQATLQHVVMNFDPVNGRRIYVNGVFTDDNDLAGNLQASIAAWNEDIAFSLGSEPGSTNGATTWQGKFRLLAIHNRALTVGQIQQNFSAGVGQKYYMLFAVDTAGSYIVFEVEIYDNYSYLFSSPRFINLNTGWVVRPIQIQGMRIGVNGKEAVGGQAFANLNTAVSIGEYTADGQLLSSLGTIIALEKGPDSDEFFLTFERLDGRENAYVEASPVPPVAAADVDMVSKIGVRTFDELNATMSAITGVAVTNASISGKFDLYRRQLPSVSDIEAYLSSHQMAVAQLAMKYCDVLVETNPAYFAPFNFGQTPSVALANSTGRNNVLNPLLTSIMNVDLPSGSKNLGSQPNETVVRDTLGASTIQVLGEGYTNQFSSLMDCMTRCPVGGQSTQKCTFYTDEVPDTGDELCTSGEVAAQNTLVRTKQIVKATCAAALGSAVMLMK